MLETFQDGAFTCPVFNRHNDVTFVGYGSVNLGLPYASAQVDIGA